MKMGILPWNWGPPCFFCCCSAKFCQHHALDTSISVNLHVGRAKYNISYVQKHIIIANKDHMSTCNCSQSMPQIKSRYWGSFHGTIHHSCHRQSFSLHLQANGRYSKPWSFCFLHNTSFGSWKMTEDFIYQTSSKVFSHHLRVVVQTL